MLPSPPIAPAVQTAGAPAPRAELLGMRGYRPQPAPPWIDLRLDANEGLSPLVNVAEIARQLGAEGARRYPSARELEADLAAIHGVPDECVVVTAGGDDAIDRACRAYLGPGRELILPVPTFEMIERGGVLAGASIVKVDWSSGAFPLEAVLGAITPRTAMISIVSPNNPTGLVATAADVATLARAAPHALVLVDGAYAEFAEQDLTAEALRWPSAIVVRTFSKAYGLAGLRVGYAIGSPGVIEVLRAAGAPFPTGAVGVACAREALRTGAAPVAQLKARVREERAELATLAREDGFSVEPGEANFLLLRGPRALWLKEALAGLGILVRTFKDTLLARCVRVTLPGDGPAFARLRAGVRAALAPEAVLLDMDGVIADVSRSYRAAILATARTYGVELTAQDVAAAKALPGSNNDWHVTRRMLAERGVEASLEEVTARFEAIYQGTGAAPGLRETETLLTPRALLESLRGRTRLAIVTGRPRADARAFLERFAIADLFEHVVCMEDAPTKPDPAPVLLAMKLLGVRAAWMVGDTPDDVIAARRAGVVPIGIPPPSSSPGHGPDDVARVRGVLASCGAARVIDHMTELETLLP